ncbi:hypothetical protein BC937DRAFT_91534 [Endogone sp. FLAS-F59071]|nr:hypothetical protein BC937DRAFT_91534 [Endogone sp. FLAS-F59071]|eukprot:RUS21746.1 hypothetical protein BC937DRAFT_91534 [Endogone sp. FLAS-F59071]
MAEEFRLHEELLRLQEDPKEFFIPNAITIEGANDKELERYLNDTNKRHLLLPGLAIILSLKRASLFRAFSHLKTRIAARLLDIILSGFENEIKSTSDDIDTDETDSFPQHRLALEMYGFILQWFVNIAEEKATSKVAPEKTAAVAKPKKGRAGKAREEEDSGPGWDWTKQKQKTFDLMVRVLELRINKIWTLAPERDVFISVFTKPAFQVFENKNNSKAGDIKTRVFKVLGICITQYNQAFAAQTTIIQDLQYWEHSADMMAEFLFTLAENHDYTQLTDEILREIASKEFKDTTTKEVKDTPNPKTFAAFLVKLSELLPKSVLKNMGLLIGLLDSESYAIRMAIIEILGNLIVELANTEAQTPMQKDQINKFFDILEERFLDNNAFVRSKVLQVYLKLLDLRAKFPKRRQTLCDFAIRHLNDKSSHVRKNAIKVLTRSIATHPYSMYGGELIWEQWETRREELKEKLAALKLPEELQEIPPESGQNEKRRKVNGKQRSNDDEEKEEAEESLSQGEDSDVEMADADAEQEEPAPAPSGGGDAMLTDEQVIQLASAEEAVQLDLQKRFCTDAITFIMQIHAATPIIVSLLASKTKAEVLEAMDFLVVAYNYKIEAAADGIKKMSHLIWTKDNSDEGKGVKTKLLECYQHLYLESDGNLSPKENVNMITKNLIQLTFNTTLAELTSLEQVLSTLMAENHIEDNVIDKLWAVYGVTKRAIPKAQRRGAIIILGMLAKAKMEIVSEKTDLLLSIGLGPLGKLCLPLSLTNFFYGLGQADLSLARYTCIALQRLGGNKTKEKGRALDEGIRLPMSLPIFERLKDIVIEPSTSTEWYGVAEQAINTIYLLGEHPDVLCSEIIKIKATQAFGIKAPEANIENEMQVDEENVSSAPQEALRASSVQLSQLFFVVGHVAVKHIVHLEIIEAVWKRKKAKTEFESAKKAEKGDDELEQVAGTAEDEIGDAISHIRERELLFGDGSLLATFGPLLTHVCANNTIYHDRTLQITATLALTKLMCISSDFCEANLQLLFTILEKSTDPTIRSNIVIALGDMAVCFNTLIDENIAYLYNRLSDPDPLVKKNTLMVLTHLILNGMIKVKGQIGEMAKCLEDEERRISDLAKLFFTELSSKDNAIYNNLPDIISNLSGSESKVDEETFKKIMKFLFDFIDKDKQAENVVEKLCQRFRNAEGGRAWRDISLCLSLLPYKSEKSFKKLLEGMPNYQDKIHEEVVYKNFTDIVAKGRAQKSQKPEMKAAIDEFESRLEELRVRGVEAQEVEQNVVITAKKVAGRKASALPKGSKTKGKKEPAKESVKEPVKEPAMEPVREPTKKQAPKTPRAHRAKQGKKKAISSEEEQEEEQEEVVVKTPLRTSRVKRGKKKLISSEEEQEEEREKVVAKAPPRASRAKRGKKVISSEEEEKEQEEQEEQEEVVTKTPPRTSRVKRGKKMIFSEEVEEQAKVVKTSPRASRATKAKKKIISSDDDDDEEEKEEEEEEEDEVEDDDDDYE